MTIRWPNLRDLSVGDVLIVIALITVVGALFYPSLRARTFRGLVEDAATDVETMSTAARGVFRTTGAWPTPSEAGGIPIEVAAAFPGQNALSGDDYALQWRRWEVVEQVEGPPEPIGPNDADAPPDSVGPRMISVARPVGAIVVHSARAELLAELLGRYGRSESFVKDSSWTLIIDEEEPSSP